MSTEMNAALSRDAYHSPTPVLLVDRSNRIIDLNLALAVLLGDDGTGCRGSRVDDFASTLGTRLQGKLVPPEVPPYGKPNHDLERSTQRFAADSSCFLRYRSPQYGTIDFIGTGVCHQDPISGSSMGIVCYWEIVASTKCDAFRRVFLDCLGHELMWEMYAISYDRILLEMKYYQLVLRRHHKALSAPGIERVVDIGAGTGNLVERLLKDGKMVLAIDVGRAMLARLRAKPWAATDRLVVRQQSAERLSMAADASFDGVNILLALYDMEHPEAALDEAIRVLRPGGRIVVTEPRRRFDLEIILHRCTLRLKRLGKYDQLEADMKRVTMANEGLDPNCRPTSSPLRAEDVYDRLCEQGFLDVSIRDSHYRQCATVIGTRPGR